MTTDREQARPLNLLLLELVVGAGWLGAGLRAVAIGSGWLARG